MRRCLRTGTESAASRTRFAAGIPFAQWTKNAPSFPFFAASSDSPNARRNRSFEHMSAFFEARRVHSISTAATDAALAPSCLKSAPQILDASRAFSEITAASAPSVRGLLKNMKSLALSASMKPSEPRTPTTSRGRAKSLGASAIRAAALAPDFRRSGLFSNFAAAAESAFSKFGDSLPSAVDAFAEM